MLMLRADWYVGEASTFDVTAEAVEVEGVSTWGLVEG